MSFLANKLRERELFIKKTASLNDRDSLLSDLYSTFTTMSKVGVNNEKDYRDFFYILAHVPTLSKEILNRKPNNVELSKISNVVYENRNNCPINTICNFYKAVEEAITKMASIKKIAYPQEYGFNYIPKEHDLSKWVQTMRQIYAMKSRGVGGLEAFNKVTEKWNVMEKRDFKNWLNFYESKSHLSYKLAAADNQRVYYEVGGVPLPIGMTPRQQPIEEDIIEEEKPKADDLSNVVKQLLGRIASAEKIYTDPYKSPIFRKLLGEEYEAWLTTLHQLKRKIQTLELKNASTLVDVIERFGNQLRSQGMVKTASLLVKVAQGAPPPPPVGGASPTPKETSPDDIPPPELDMLGGPPEGSEATGEDTSDPDAAMEEFLENIGAKSSDEKEKEEKEEIYEADDEASIVVSEEDHDLYKTAQGAPPLAPPAKPPMAKPPAPKSPEDALDSALKNITIADVIKELEEISVLYKNRPLSMKLTKVDLMMQHLGLSPYFPNMAEAMKSSLDSNQYVLTRIDDVLAKLRGAAAAGSGKLEELQDTLEKSEETMAQKRQQRATVEMQPSPESPAPAEAPAKEPIKEAPELKRPVEVAPPQPGVRV